MNFLIGLGIVIVVVVIALLSHNTEQVGEKRQKYLKKLADFLESEVKPYEGHENSFQIKFVHKEREFEYLDIEDFGFKTSSFKAFLKMKAVSNLTLSFSEKSRTTIRAKVESLDDMTSPWTASAEQLQMPKELNRLSAYTNNPDKARRLLVSEKVVKVFASFETQQLGHPLMSLEIIEGVIKLKFHPPGDLKPNLGDLQFDVSTIDQYLDKMMMVVTYLEKVEAQLGYKGEESESA